MRTHAADVSETGRNTQGVRLIKLAEDAKLVGVERIVESVNGNNGDTDGEAAPGTDDELDA